MSVPPKILCAAGRWLRLLTQGSFVQAQTFLSNDVRYTDLTRDQYSRGFDLLQVFGLYSLDSGLNKTLLNSNINEVLIQLAIECLIYDGPVWFDEFLIDEAIVDPPSEVMSIMVSLELPESRSAEVVRRAFGKVDLERRSEIGAAGESELIRCLDQAGVDSVIQVSRYDDGAGYDLLAVEGGVEYHLEVKATTKRRSVSIFLSRNEYETSTLDSNWRLVIVGLDSAMRMVDLATVDRQVVCSNAPVDRIPLGRWESAQLQFPGILLNRNLVLGNKTVWDSSEGSWWE